MRRLRLFVSSSRDLVVEREVIGQAVAELPVRLGWEIGHTPGPEAPPGPAPVSAAQCDIYIIVLGMDLTAPMGVEWHQARRAGQVPLAFRKAVHPSPAADLFQRESGIEWVTFEEAGQLKRLVLEALARRLLERGEFFGLHLPEVEALSALLERLTEEEAPATLPSEARRGAGRGGVILPSPTPPATPSSHKAPPA